MKTITLSDKEIEMIDDFLEKDEDQLMEGIEHDKAKLINDPLAPYVKEDLDNLEEMLRETQSLRARLRE